MTTKRTAGIHHITAFAKNAQENVDFYTGVLGLRLVKKTVNFDAPEVYHFYFGNEQGSPGTIITFFPWESGRKGKVGGGQVGVTSFVVPLGAIGFWKERLQNKRISVIETKRFGEVGLQFSDHDGLQLEIIEREQGPTSKWSFAGVPTEMAIKGFGGARLCSTAPAYTATVLETVMGLEKVGAEGEWTRFKATGDLGNIIDLKTVPVDRGAGGYGTVHHIAWRAADYEDLEQWRAHVQRLGFQPTPVIDRQYFNAIYFREQGGILFEIATDPPGFTRDESFQELGSALKLPDQYEQHRSQLEKLLPSVEVNAEGGN